MKRAMVWAAALAALTGCRSATCPPGFQAAGDRCAPLDGSVDEEGGVCRSYRDVDGDGFGDSAQSMLGCPPPSGYVDNDRDCDDTNPAVRPTATEVCNGVDDDCDGQIDDGFDCEQNGVNVPCVTDCGSTGVGSCDASCNATACTPPAESCTYADDDCDGQIDEMQQSLVAALPYSDTSEPARTWTFGGADPVVFTVYRGGAITARRFDASGAPTGTEQVIFTIAIELELGNFLVDVARASDRYVFLLPNADGSVLEARLFAAADFAPIGEPLVVGETALQAAQVAADDDNVLIATVGEGGLRLLATDRDLTPRGPASSPVSGVAGPVALEARPGSLDWWLAYSRQVGSDFHIFVQKVRPIGTLVGSAIDVGPTTSGVGALFPELAVADDGTVGILFAQGQPPSELRMQVRRGTDGGLLSELALPGEWGFCLYFTVPYCRPSSLTWTGSRWLVTRISPDAGAQATRMQAVSPDGGTLLEDVLLATSADQRRMASAARLPSGAALITVPTPDRPLYARWGCP